MFVFGVRRLQEGADLIVVASGTEQRAVLAVARLRSPRVVQQLVPDEERDTERPAGVAGRRLNPQILERSLAEDAAVADTVERDAAGEAQVLHPRLLVYVAGTPEHDLLSHFLDGRGDIHIAMRDPRVGFAWRCAEKPMELR